MNPDEPSSILIVDDIQNNIFALEQILSKPDRRILAANSGNEALKIVLNESVDLIILDVQMPEMDGFEVAQIIKSGRRTKDIPIIFATAHMKDQKFLLKGLEEGAVDYLFKPLDPDITEAKVSLFLKLQSQRQELLKKNKALERSALLIDNSADIICIVNPEKLEFEEMNRAVHEILGYESKSFVHQSILEHIREDFHELIRSKANSDNESLNFEVVAKTKDLKEKWLNWNIIHRENLWFVNIRDVTKLREFEDVLQQKAEELESINKELESFSYSVSHDLRAPLRSISGFSDFLNKKYETVLDDTGKRYLSFIVNGVSNMELLIDGLLNLSRLGRRQISGTKLDFDIMVHEILKFLITETEKKVEFEINPLGLAFGDSAMIKQIWQNLISNAIKYSSKKPNPKIIIGKKEDQELPVYFVKDNGAGFDMNYASKLFSAFQRLHTAEEFEGSGIGLATVQRIVNKHGGKIWAEAEIEKGATFYFTLSDN